MDASPHAVGAGVVAGAVGCVVFLSIHAIWILPIWFVALPGLALACGGGAVVGWAYGELGPRLPRRPLTAFALTGLVAVTLAPSMVAAELSDPMFVIAPGGEAERVMGIGRMSTLFVLELVVLSAATGALLGWLLERTRPAALAMSVAALVFALGPGHNIPFLGDTGGWWKGAVLAFAPSLVAAIVLVELSRWRDPRRGAGAPGGSSRRVA